MATAENHLIDLLPPRERQRLLDVCEPVQLVPYAVLSESGERTRHVYFPVDGYASLVARVDHHPGLEVGMVGREGMLGVQVVLGVPLAPLHAVVQGGGAAWRVGADDFRSELARSAALRQRLGLYVHVLMAQLASSAACLRFHTIAARLARWLLMSQDRAHADRFQVTQEFLAYMLGVRRVGITHAAGELQRCGLIAYSRGDMRVLERAGLEASACACYAADQKAYRALL